MVKIGIPNLLANIVSKQNMVVVLHGLRNTYGLRNTWQDTDEMWYITIKSHGCSS